MDATNGDDADEFGARIFDLSPNGCNFKIKCERQGDFPTYVSSRFASPSKLKDMDEEKVYSSAFELDTVFPVKSYDELKKVLNEHFYCGSDSSDSSDGPDWGDNKQSSAKASEPEPTKEDKTENIDPLDDDKVKQLLDGLGD